MNHGKYAVEVSSYRLADWLDGQPGSWWYVDGDPLLTSEVDFPCPNEELSQALRRHKSTILVFPRFPAESKVGRAPEPPDLDELADTENPRKEKKILAAWNGSDIEWLLSEDKFMAEEARRTAVESLDAKATN